MNGESTKKVKPTPDALRAEYNREDLGKGVRGKYYKEYREGTNLVLLAPDVTELVDPGDEAQ